ncbi:zinc finger protein 37-like [Lytechinus variegatus]|uniref:zinc finger protein 37-like n=1 Tax=Lytechinus variegatus TaxID=7654 RepID=UPI001BB2AFCE|nr:zinc finger protein 37-like [Lytechinus variegatus]
MEDVENIPGDLGNESVDASQVHIVSQKDIHDFWEHVSTGDRINDVCTTFESESKQVIEKLYQQSASVGEQFAVANFLLQIGALQFRVQKNPEDENELQTIIILQKPDTNEGKTEEKVDTQDTAEDPNHNKDKECPDIGENEKEKERDNLALWDGDPPPVENEEEPLVPPPPEEHECSICHAVLTSLWELDLHELNRCSSETPPPGRPAKKQKEPEITSVSSDEQDPDLKSPAKSSVPEKKKRGRPRKNVVSPLVPPQEVQGSAKRKRGRPRKSDTFVAEEESMVKKRRGRPSKKDSIDKKQESSKKDVPVLANKHREESLSKLEKPHTIQLPKPKLHTLHVRLNKLQETRSKRKRRLPQKLREVLGEEEMTEKEVKSVVEPDDADLEVADPEETGTKDVSPEDCGPEKDEESGEDPVEEDERKVDDIKDGQKKDGPAEEDQVKNDAPARDDDPVKGDVLNDDQGIKEGLGEAEAGHPSEVNEMESEVQNVPFGNLKEHMNDVDVQEMHGDDDGSDKSGEKIYSCRTCGKSFRQVASFRAHLIMHRNKAANSKFESDVLPKADGKSHQKRTYPCEFCGKVFSEMYHYKRHKNNVHTKEVSYPCTLCDRVFFTKSRLKDHMVTHSGKKDVACDMCDLMFFLPSQLKIHKKTVHVEGKPYLCDLCGSSFKAKGILKQHHLTVHTDIKKFPCRQCGKPFSRSSLRNQHEKVHSGLNPYPCEYCGKGFRDKFKLRVHVNWHLGIHPFACDVCGKTFLVKGNLTKHMRVHTGERPYVCQKCGRGCVDSSQLKKHMSQAHQIQVDRILTKGPGRPDGDLPSTRRKKKQDDPLVPLPGGLSADAEETQAYTIATDALIEISQQLADMSNTVQVPVGSGNLMIDAKANDGQTPIHQQGENSVVPSHVTNVVSTTEASSDAAIIPVMIQVADQPNQVTVPVTQSIGDFQSLELITL